MIQGQLIARRVNFDPRGYRMVFEEVEVGSIFKRHQHFQYRTNWHWDVDRMPLMDCGDRPPSGEEATFQAALDNFRASFFKWVNAQPSGEWVRNRDYLLRPVTERRGL